MSANDLPLFSPPPARPLRAAFNGPVYSPGDDDTRLTDQIRRVFDAIKDGRWRTVAEIAAATGDPENSVSAQLRHLRKSRFGSWNVERRTRAGHRNLHEYRLNGRIAPNARTLAKAARLAAQSEELLREVRALRERIERLEREREVGQ